MSLSAEDAVAIESLAADAGFVSEPDDGRFHVTLDNFDGPFDLLLSLISRRQLDVTEVALSQVTDEFITLPQRGRRVGPRTGDRVPRRRSTLLDLKAARLLPAAEVDDEEDIALLEARDLLFARLLQYRAYKLAAAYLGELERAQAPRFGRSATIDAAVSGAAARGRPVGQPDAVRCAGRARTRAAAGAADPDRPRPRPAGQRRRAHGGRSESGCGGRAPRPSDHSSPIAGPPWRSSPDSWPCSSSTVTAWSPSTRSRRSPSCGCAGPRRRPRSPSRPNSAARLVDEEYG